MSTKLIFRLLAIAILYCGRLNADKNNLKATEDCSGVVGFSSSGVSKVHSTGFLQFKTNIYDSAHGWNRDTGAFTVICPGIYSVSFTTHGSEGSRFTLKKRTISGSFVPIISTPPGGGSNSVVISLDKAEQLLLSLNQPGGGLRTDLESSTPVNTFTVYKLSEQTRQCCRAN